METVNPATGEKVRDYAEMDGAEVAGILRRARAAHESWRAVAFVERAARMRRAAALLRERKEPYARLMAVEIGKPVAQGRGEVEKCAWVCEYYAEHAQGFLSDEPVP